MRRKKAGLRQRLTLVLALAMVLSLFAAGCGDPGGSAPDSSGNPAAQDISPLGQETARVGQAQPEGAAPSAGPEAAPAGSPADSGKPANTPALDAGNGGTPAQPANTSEAPGNTPGASGSISGNSENIPGASGNMPAEPSFAVHYIDVGQADAALVLCDGKSMLIDGGNAEDSNLIYAYLKKLSLDHLDYIVCTHAHEDHAGGLSGALNYATVDVALAPVTSYDNKAFGNFVSYLAKQNVPVTVPSAGQSFSLGSATVHVLGPVSSTSDTNNTSIVLRVGYAETSFLFTGDAGREEEQDILNAGYTLNSTVLKVGHHGSDTSTSYVWLREIMPEYAVISVGKGNSYGHPAQAVLSRLRDADVKTYRTDMQGDVICTSDGKTVSFSVSRNADADTLADAGAGGSGGSSQSDAASASPDPSPAPTPSTAPVPTPVPEAVDPIPAGTDYVLNTNTHKFHYPSCGSVKQMSEKNKWAYNGSRDDVIAMGYVACKKCKP